MAIPSKRPAQPQYRTGDVIAGKYRLESVLGEGGMGVVWSALNLQLEAPVAIKLLLHNERDRAVLTQRLKQEAKVAAKLGHPAIVRIFDVGESEQGDPFMVMELLRGKTLAARLAAEGSLTATHAVQMLLPIADALAIAHSKGIVHRDLKPDNVFVNEDEQQIQPKLVDFGIVKISDPDSEQTHLTQSGTVVGSPDYMSPEQARGLEVDHRTDIWSLCVVLYEAITGTTPFAAANANALLVSIVLDDPRPFEPRSKPEAELVDIIFRGLTKDREQRFQSMADLGKALAAWLLQQNIAEDVCGNSVESKWILRSSDPGVLRGSRPSFATLPTSARGSGIRAAVGDPEAAPIRSQPVANEDSSSEQLTLPQRLSRPVLVGIGLATSLLLASLLALTLKRAAPADASRNTPHESTPVSTVPEAPRVESVPSEVSDTPRVVPSPTPGIVPVTPAATAAPSGSAGTPKTASQRSVAKRVKGAAVADRPPASSNSASSDLLSPY